MNARILLPVLVSCFPASLAAQPASPQASRTWVSGVGDDVNPCSRTAPCKTFAGALLKTSAGGEINCLDPGGFGESVVSGNSAGLTVGTTGGPSVMLVDSTVTNNAAAGLSASGGSARIWVSNSTISGNGTGVQAANGATIASYGDNRLDGNGTNGQFTGPAAPRR